jgi:uncharacterized protein (TIGR03437 family)
MGPLIRSGRRLTGLNLFALLLLSATSATFAQTGPLFCVASADPLLVRSEGLAERLGDILIDCSGGVPGRAVQTNLTIFLPVNVTNRLSTEGALDTQLLLSTGGGFVPSGTPAFRHSSNAVAFNGISFTIPETGRAALLVTNLRGAVNQLGMTQRPIQASLAFTTPSPITLQNNQPTVAIAERGLLATYLASGIRCVGSPLPSTVNIPNLMATGTAYFPARVAEGTVTAFGARDPATETNGTRIISRYSNFPANARLFVPDVLTGSTPELLLVRVIGTDTNGAGGVPLTPGMGGVSETSVTEVALTNGTGAAVYEVVRANPQVRERFEIPTWLGMPRPTEENAPIATQQITFGPVSTVAVADAVSPVPRFVATPALVDCRAMGDCDADYYPRLITGGDALQFTGFSGALAWAPRYIQVRNENVRTSEMFWTTSVSYTNGSGWLRVEPASGWNNATIRVDAILDTLTPGRYEATLTIDAGLAGSRTFPVVAIVNSLPTQPQQPQPPPQQPPAIVTSIGNAASPWPGAVTPGSLAAIRGSRLRGASVSVTFDDVPARLLAAAEEQLTVLVPVELAGRESARMTITVDGVVSGPHTALVAVAAPAIFPGGVLNEDNTVNAVNAPAPAGSFVQIFATGLFPAVGQAAVTAKIHDREVVPVYAGTASGTGLHQVNIRVPEDLPAMTTEVLLCVTAQGGQRVCSLPLNITVGN